MLFYVTLGYIPSFNTNDLSTYQSHDKYRFGIKAGSSIQIPSKNAVVVSTSEDPKKELFEGSSIEEQLGIVTDYDPDVNLYIGYGADKTIKHATVVMYNCVVGILYTQRSTSLVVNFCEDESDKNNNMYYTDIAVLNRKALVLKLNFLNSKFYSWINDDRNSLGMSVGGLKFLQQYVKEKTIPLDGETGFVEAQNRNRGI